MNTKVLGLAALLTVVSASSASAAVLIRAEQRDNGVKISYGGSLDLSNLPDFVTNASNIGDGFINPSRAVVAIGTFTDIQRFKQLPVNLFTNAPLNFGNGKLTYADTSGGDAFWIGNSQVGDYLALEDGYQSGSEIKGWSFYNNATLNSLGLRQNEKFSFGLSNGETIDGEIEAVPEPLTILGTGLAIGIGGIMKKRQKQAN